jgi:hypothetical protein
MAKTISFLATKRLPQLGQLDKKEKYSVILVLFQLCEQERHFIPKSTHTHTNKLIVECVGLDVTESVILF